MGYRPLFERPGTSSTEKKQLGLQMSVNSCKWREAYKKRKKEGDEGER